MQCRTQHHGTLRTRTQRMTPRGPGRTAMTPSGRGQVSMKPSEPGHTARTPSGPGDWGHWDTQDKGTLGSHPGRGDPRAGRPARLACAATPRCWASVGSPSLLRVPIGAGAAGPPSPGWRGACESQADQGPRRLRARVRDGQIQPPRRAHVTGRDEARDNRARGSGDGLRGCSHGGGCAQGAELGTAPCAWDKRSQAR